MTYFIKNKKVLIKGLKYNSLVVIFFFPKEKRLTLFFDSSVIFFLLLKVVFILLCISIFKYWFLHLENYDCT